MRDEGSEGSLPEPGPEHAPRPEQIGTAEAVLPLPEKRRSTWLTVVKLAVSAALIAWVISGVDLARTGRLISGAQPGLVTLALAMPVIGYALGVLRWRSLIQVQGRQAPVSFLLRSYMVAIFFNNLLPSTIGGDAIRMYDTWRLGTSKAAAMAVVIVDRFLGVIALLCFATAAVFAYGPYAGSFSPVVPSLLAGAAVAGAATWLLFTESGGRFIGRRNLDEAQRSSRIRRVVAKIDTAFQPFRGRTGVLVRAFALSCVLQTNVVLFYLVVARSLGLQTPLLGFFIVVPLTLFAMMLPITINGIGIREGVFVFFLAQFGVSADEALAFTWLAYGLLLIHAVVGGVVWMVSRDYGRLSPLLAKQGSSRGSATGR